MKNGNDMVSHELVTNFLRTLAKQGVPPSKIFSGIHNAFVHGDIFMENGSDFGEKDEHLKEIFRGIEITMAAINKAEDF